MANTRCINTAQVQVDAGAGRELDRKKRKAMFHQIQQIMHDRVLHVPSYELAFP